MMIKKIAAIVGAFALVMGGISHANLSPCSVKSDSCVCCDHDGDALSN